jgi:hypothetical protein
MKKEQNKTYLAIFVCFSTKTVHIEVVTSLSSPACIAALRRFAARRGTPTAMYSDNGTNFVGARKEIMQLKAQLDTTFPKFAHERDIMWSMIPPGSPHFGGLWEAAVKSAKLHLKKVVGKSILTFEEMQTLMCDVEAIMNSRPLVQASTDANDLVALTPNMLLTGKNFISFPLAPPKALSSADMTNRSHKRWMHVNNLASNFWKRWSAEYLTALQTREKWAEEKDNLIPGDLVLVADENYHPLLWPLGRIIKTFTGNDGIARAVLLKTAKGTYKRPATKLRLLPNQRENKVLTTGDPGYATRFSRGEYTN